MYNENNKANYDVENKDQSADTTSQELFNLIQSIQSKLNDNQDTNENENQTEKIKEEEKIETKNIDNDNKNSNNSNFDLSSISSLLKNVDISSILNLLNNNNNNNNETKNNDALNNNSGFDFGNIDPSIFLKIQKILSTVNQNDPRKNLLLSLKPFLRKSRQDKLSEYITMLSIAKAIGIFNSKGSDNNV